MIELDAINNDKILILKDDYNSFEKFYLEELKDIYSNTSSYYISNCKIRKIWTHCALPFEDIWYGHWKYNLAAFETIIVFDSIHSSKMLEYIHNHSNGRLIYWHWNPIKEQGEIDLINNTRNICEHWTFNDMDAQKYHMKLNNQFFFFRDFNSLQKSRSAFFVGLDKGRYEKIVQIANLLTLNGVNADFHIIEPSKKGKFYECHFMEYTKVLKKIEESQFMVEIVQKGQNGLTARALEAMFSGTKLISNNKYLKNCTFYNKNNIYILDDKENFNQFIRSDFVAIETKLLLPYSAQGWMKNFIANDIENPIEE